MRHNTLKVFLTAAALAAASVAAAVPGDAPRTERPFMLGKGKTFGVQDIPRGRLRNRIERLRPEARARAIRWMHERFEFPAADLAEIQVDDDGAFFYVEPSPFNCFGPLCPQPVLPEAGDPADGSFPQLSASAAEDAFFLHSRPGAPNTLYLDFDGHSFSDTAWGSGTIHAKPFDTDGDPSSFSSGERAAIAEIWHRVAEDFAPFDINVTTEEPASFDARVGRILITSKTQTNGSAMPYNSGGGVAYVGVFGFSSYGYYSPALVYYDNLASNATYIAEASSHEFGHNLGLSHDGTANSTYYAGHGSGSTSWAPIMGNSYYNNVTQWSRGEYAGANNPQDDIAIIAGKLGLVPDDHGNDRASATPLAIGVDGQVLVSDPELDPHNSYPENKGVIGIVGDWDYFVFEAGAGQVDLTVNPAWQAFYRTSRRGANLDVRAVLQDADGNTLASSDPTSDTFARVTATVAAGTYYLAVTGVGSANYSTYASQGQYFVSGSVPSGTAPNEAPTAAFGYGCNALSCSFTDASSDIDGSIVAWSWSFGDGSTSTTRNPSHAYAAGGSYTVTLTVTDDDGETASTSQSVSVVTPNLAPSADFSASCNGLNCSFTDASNDSDGNIVSWAWNFGDGHTSSARNPGHNYASDGTYTVALTVTDDNGATAFVERDVAAASNQDPTVVFFDDFADASLAPWSQLQSGTVSMVSDPTYGWVLRKAGNNDPHGGWAPLGSTVSDFELALFARKVDTAGGDLVRYSITDSGGNGYGLYLDYSKGTLSIERRTGWGGTTLVTSSVSLPGGMGLGSWYTLRLVRTGQDLAAAVYAGRVDPDASAPALTVTGSDNAFSTFSQVNVNGGHKFDTASLRVSVPAVTPDPLVIASTTLPAGQEGAAYSAALQASGGVAPHQWSLFSGSLPEGLALDVAGNLAGTATSAGEFSFTVRLTDAVGATTTQALTLTIDASTGRSLVFSDDFEDGTLAPWTQLQSGTLTLVNDPTHGWVLRKTVNNDPHGGKASLGTNVSDFELVLFSRKVNTAGGDLMRYSLTDSAGNGYGIYLDYKNGTLTIERRNAWSGTALATTNSGIPGGVNLGGWYTLRLTRQGSALSAELHTGKIDPASSTPALSASATDGSFGSFYQVNINGGRDFDTDDIRVYTDSTASQPETVFADDFTDGTLAPWTQLQSGSVNLINDPTHGWVLRKTTNNDPHGGQAPLESPVSDFELVVFTRKVNTAGGALMRYSVTDINGDGYGVHLDYSNGRLTIERRDNWGGTSLVTTTVGIAGGVRLGDWYTLRLVRQGHALAAEAYIGRVEPTESLAAVSSAATDSRFGLFDRVNVNGGRDFDTDQVVVRGR
jgi:PKD repeat protein